MSKFPASLAYRALLTALLFTMAGCATIASGPYGVYLGEAGTAAKLKISAGEVSSMSSTYFGEIEFTLENPTAEWVRIEKVALDFGGEKANQVVYFPWGDQIESWAEATHYRNVVRATNDAMALELIGVGVAVLGVAASSGHGPGRAAGGLATMAAVSAIAVGAANAEAAAATPSFGGQHLFAVPIEVPPGLFVKRYVVVNTPADPSQPCLTNLILTYELGDHTSHRVAMTFRGESDVRASQWQRWVCEGPLPKHRR